LAAIHAVEFSKEMGFYDILLEDDALQIVIENKAEGKKNCRFGHLMDKIKDDMRHLWYWIIDYVKLDANSAARDLVKEAVKHIIDKI
jgi:hypothetical protein